jgi:hypothetical protein
LLFDMDPVAPGNQICTSVSVGGTVEIDAVILNVDDLAAFQFVVLSLNPGVLELTGRDVRLFLASVPGASIIDLSDPLPDSDDYYGVVAANFGPPPGASGSGTLARLTLTAVEAGEGVLVPFEVVLSDSSSNAIEVSSGLPGWVYIGEPCP